ncbi:hypothetical protein CXB51_026285 [Gossypium anomalum]|uniref:Uncharacterized protein n=1 Tax=Gossypium anomalum TaxID=47600 RepID=A0A8J6CS48_9ROSI|nr:hypothetical protein CXB51_026285 [Gossypium anomalum]
MGKNQAYKAMQRARLGSSSAGPEEIEDGMVDGSFHSPEWHAARLASLKTSHTVTWEEFKKKQKEDALRKGELEADTDRMMREYRAQLDAERASKLAHGRNHSSSKCSHKRGVEFIADRKDKDSKKRSSKRESVQDGGLLSQAPQVHPQNLRVVMMKRENQEDPSPSLEERRKRSTNQEIRTQALRMKKVKVQSHCQFFGSVKS